MKIPGRSENKSVDGIFEPMHGYNLGSEQFVDTALELFITTGVQLKYIPPKTSE